MKCVKCNKREGTINIPSLEKKACTQCFKEIIERRFNKNMRINYPKLRTINIKISRPSDNILLYLLKEREKKSRNLTIKTGKKSSINQWTLDDIAISVIESLTTGDKNKIKQPGPLSDTSEKELSEYARIKKIKFKENPRIGKEKELYELIQKLDKRRPGVMHSIKRFRDKLECV